MADSNLVQQCRTLLSERWRQVSDAGARPLGDETLTDAIRRSVNSKTKTYRYVLPTQLVAKLADPSLDCTCVQAKRGGSGAFDARSIAQDAVVPFDQANDRVLGGAPEPYANNPLRIPEISADYRDAQKDKSGWDDLCLVLNAIQKRADPQFTQAAFDQTLAEILVRLGTVRIVYPAPIRISLDSTMSLIEQFTGERSGGDRFEVITSALFHAAGLKFGLFRDVRRSSITTADASSGMVTDIECIDEAGEIVLVVEAKDRDLTSGQVKGKVTRIREHKVTEAFFIASRIGASEGDAIARIVRKEFVSGQNLYTMELLPFARVLLSILGEAGRGQFIDSVGQQLDRYSDVVHRKAWAALLATI